MAVDAFSREVFARTIWMEARNQGDEGLTWVAHSIYNRFQSKAWYSGPTLALVCLRDQQYSCWNAAKDDNNREQMAALSDSDPMLVKCRVICDRVLNGDIDPTSGATHYFDKRLPQWPLWEKAATLAGEVGVHRFYKDVP